MAKASRDKGARGEREVVNLFREAGFSGAHRTAQLQAGRVPGAADVALSELPFHHIEVKRDERMSVDAMVRQAEAEAALSPLGATPIVAWRRNGGEWRADVSLTWLAGLLGAARNQAALFERMAYPLWHLRTDGTLKRIDNE